MSSVQTQTPPEAQGPGTYDEQSGAVRYGDDGQGQVRIGRMPLPSPEERARSVAGLDIQCPHCAGIPREALAAMQAALAAGKAAR